jgi:hypothetical protein
VYHYHFSASDFYFYFIFLIFGEQSQNDLVAFMMGFAALWAISKWVKNEIAQSESVRGLFFSLRTFELCSQASRAKKALWKKTHHRCSVITHELPLNFYLIIVSLRKTQKIL